MNHSDSDQLTPTTSNTNTNTNTTTTVIKPIAKGLLSHTSSSTTLVDYGKPPQEVFALKDTFNGSSCILKGADSPGIYKHLLAKNHPLENNKQEQQETKTTTIITTTASEKETVEIPVLRGPECPNTYARYF
ncbi:hypothetical protein DASC09_015660 [Saccharomycopsis crataegensis]|uniref:Uncharacterized protein n=1 Tax=Saccharomycopsis crataegensis TaxID=43959 RepID=A0AAV5QHU2_9ASCO|nr:hypothetical protein DASC09_015660 [Saccharomycopsis crataegensis]